MRDCRVDGVFCDVTFHANIIVVTGFLRKPPALFLHLVGGLPGTDDNFADAPHGLTVRRYHRESADVVQDILGCDGFLADATFRERKILRDRRIEMVAHHYHVEMLFDGVLSKRPGWIG